MGHNQALRVGQFSMQILGQFWVQINIKGTTSSGKFRFNATIYHMVWDDIQIQVHDPNADFFSLGIINLAQAEIDGVEASLSWIPSANWSINGMLGYNNAELSEDAVDEDLGVDLPKGQRLPLMPKLKTNLDVRYAPQRELWGGHPGPLLIGNIAGIP